MTYAVSRTTDLLLALLHLAVTAAKLCGPGGVRVVIAENLLLKQQLIVLRRARQRVGLGEPYRGQAGTADRCALAS